MNEEAGDSMNEPNVGLVVIGKNEGKRLERALQAIVAQGLRAVYVDSGSTDGSVEVARNLGCEVVELDLARAFTAARARNTGYAKLCKVHPTLEFVQFIDGDCELNSDWIKNALQQMHNDPQAAAVGGRCREKFPDASIYNRLIDVEWNTPVGEATACGGNVLLRAAAFNEVGGFNEEFAAGEEPEMCLRMRRAGWRIWRIDAEMVLHDADITTWKQWWMRSKRSGVAYAQGAWTHGLGTERYNLRDCARIWFWALALPTGVALLAFVNPLASGCLAIGAYGTLLFRLMRERLKKGDGPGFALRYSFYTIAAKLPQLTGQFEFLLSRRSRVIDHRSAGVRSKKENDEVQATS